MPGAWLTLAAAVALAVVAQPSAKGGGRSVLKPQVVAAGPESPVQRAKARGRPC